MPQQQVFRQALPSVGSGFRDSDVESEAGSEIIVKKKNILETLMQKVENISDQVTELQQKQSGPGSSLTPERKSDIRQRAAKIAAKQKLTKRKQGSPTTQIGQEEATSSAETILGSE